MRTEHQTKSGRARRRATLARVVTLAVVGLAPGLARAQSSSGGDITVAPTASGLTGAPTASGPRAIAPANAPTIAPAVAWTPPRVALRYDLRIDIPVTGAAAVGWIVPEILKERLTGSACRFCERNADATSALNGLDLAFRGLRWDTPSTAALISDIIGYGLAPAAALGLPALVAALDRSIDQWPIDALLVAEAAAVAMVTNQTVKFIALRERPRYHFGSPQFLAMHTPPGDEILSFFSGHATFTWSLACAAGTIATMRARRYAPVVWAAGLTLAATATYLRIAADKHYFTDVFTGIAVGSAIGVLVPWLAHRPLGATTARLAVAPVRDGVTLSLWGSM